MTYLESIILAVALALDALIVSFSYGLVINRNKGVNSFLLAFAFGFFQFLMPVLGWKFTGVIYSLLELYSKWIVFLIFLILGLKILKNALENKDEIKEIKCITPCCLLCLAVATSIDAFGAGVSIRFLNSTIVKPALIIGIVTFILSYCGFWTANIFKHLPSKYVEISGALMLIYLAIKAIF